MSGQMFFEKMYGGADDKPWVDLISKKENGKYIYVEPMLNALMFSDTMALFTTGRLTATKMPT